MKIASLCVLVALTVITAGCGQKGPLVLPDAQHPRKKTKLPTQHSAPAPHSTPATPPPAAPPSVTPPSAAPAPDAPAGPAPTPGPPTASPEAAAETSSTPSPAPQ